MLRIAEEIRKCNKVIGDKGEFLLKEIEGFKRMVKDGKPESAFPVFQRRSVSDMRASVQEVVARLREIRSNQIYVVS